MSTRLWPLVPDPPRASRCQLLISRLAAGGLHLPGGDDVPTEAAAFAHGSCPSAQYWSRSAKTPAACPTTGAPVSGPVGVRTADRHSTDRV